MKRVCYEVKTSRADFLSELKRPLKRRIGMRYSNEFYFVTPAGLISLAEIPPECGLVEAGFARSICMFKQGIAWRHVLRARRPIPLRSQRSWLRGVRRIRWVQVFCQGVLIFPSCR